jgi:hypothetical protein
MIRNSIAIQDTREGLPGSVTYHWDLTDNLPGDFFRPDEWDDPAWYWPGTGVFHDGKVYLFLSEMREGEGPAGFSFQTVGTDLFVVENPGASPQEWEVSRTDFVEASDHFNVNAASLVHGEYIWFLGYVDPEDDGSRRRMFTARLSLADLESESPGDRLQFWTNADQWSASPEDLKHQFAPGVTETALHYDSKRNRFLAVGLEPFQEEILLYQAPSPAGPWEQPVHVYDVPELSESDVFVAYAARLHPMLAEGEDDLPMTYVVNTTDFWSMFSEMHIYYPRFIRIHLDE